MRYHIGVDMAVEGGDETCVVVRKGREVYKLAPEDYTIQGNTLTLNRPIEEFFTSSSSNTYGTH